MVRSLEQLKKKQLSKKTVIVAGETYFYEKAPEIIKVLLEKTERNTLIVLPDLKYYRKFLESINTKDYLLFPPMDVLPFEPVSASFSNIKSRMKTLLSYKNDSKNIITTTMGLLQNTMSHEELQKKLFSIKKGDKITQGKLRDHLQRTGYENVFCVKDPGEFSIRGFIVDFYPLHAENPYRVEFFDDEVLEIREFNPDTQRMTQKAQECIITPAKEFVLDEENENSFKERVQLLKSKYPNSRFIEDLETHPLDYSALAPLFLKDAVSALKLFEEFKLLFVNIEESIEAIMQYERDLFEIFPKTEYRELYYRHLRVSESGLLRTNEWINLAKTEPEFENSQMNLGIYELIKLDTAGIKASKKTKKTSKFLEYETETIIDEESIAHGAYIVHEDYGVGRYKGNQVITNFSGTREYVKLEYANDVTIFVPVENIDRIHTYVGDENLIRLTNLKSKVWANTKKKVREDIENKIQQLIKLYALRSKTKGIQMMGDKDMELKFFDSFPHIETPAQEKAIKEVFEEMQLENPMDRLIFGDAGSGKTEVAMRAAFRAVCSGNQVALLVPTTVLAKQHFNQFESRMKDFGVEISLLDRFVTHRKRNQIIKGLYEGTVDIVVGTHSLLSSKIKYKNLGLLIIDEEQKFGVLQKERIKSYKEKIDVLTLSATPIPRTLYMGLSGIKNMSVIDTLPPGRIPIEVASSPYNEKLIKTAILREISRGGQVIYVHNRVEDIVEIFDNLKMMIPDVKTGLAHGQMNKIQFEKTVSDFYEGEIDVLICTTIIESGVDIPNANTLIIDDSHRYGLSQLYQLRGRVGRSDRRAYAYFLYPRKTKLRPEAISRLDAITTWHGAGSGLQLSMRDMEIRGIGNILGMEQHGEINTIGLHLYRQILDDVMVKHGLKEEKKAAVEDKKLMNSVELKGFYFEILIPEEYISNNIERMKVYRKIALCEKIDDFDEIKRELDDRFGPIPQQIKSLFFYAQIRFMAGSIGIISLEKIASTKQFRFIFKDIRAADSFSLNAHKGFVNTDQNQAIIFSQSDGEIFELLKENYKKRG